MSDMRADYLKELGIGPLWHRRSSVSETATEIESGVALAGDHSAAIARMDWAELKTAAAACTACELSKKRTQAVFGVGDQNAEWLFVGEGPGAEEDAKGEPFVGQAGKYVYIANVVKCRPPGNRNPEPTEAAACEPYLARQIELIQPKLIIALGKVAAHQLLATQAAVGSLRGKLHSYRDIPLIVTYHPAYLLRTLSDKAKAWEDLCLAVSTMKELKASTHAPT
jgi:uracil-DNA glycosylase family 4